MELVYRMAGSALDVTCLITELGPSLAPSSRPPHSL